MSSKEKKELQVTEKQAVEAPNGEPTREGLMFVPEVDIIEERDQITLRADLPGVRRENVDIDVREGVLSLTATQEPLSERWQTLHGEYQVGGYARRFTLGERIDQEKIKAEMKDGVLTLVLPKAEEHKPRKIAIR
jgi:HSP20 family molecular chaperone IbpA